MLKHVRQDLREFRVASGRPRDDQLVFARPDGVPWPRARRPQLGLIAVPGAAAASWPEVGDAGDTIAAAQVAKVTGPLTQITRSIGSIDPLGDADMYGVWVGTAAPSAWTLTSPTRPVRSFRRSGQCMN